ncbi:MAG: signal peptide peptidase SppA [Pseudomonadota bacterium]|jgi:protease-4
MNTALAKIKNYVQITQLGLLKVSHWMTQSFRIGLVLLVMAYAIGVGWFVLYADKVSLDKNTVLVLDLKGALVEESPGGLKDKVLGDLQGDVTDTVRLRDLAMTLELAAKDKNIDRVLLKLDDFAGGGLVSLREAASAIEKFKASGKPVVAWSTMYDQRQYYLAAHASQVLVHPLGGVLIEGFGRSRNYYKDALDKLGIKVNLIRVGQYKSAGEPYVLNAPSPEALKAEAHVYDALWSLYTQGIEAARQLPKGSIVQNIDQLPEALLHVKGNGAQLALDWKWVDGLQTFESLRNSLMKDVATDEDTHSFRQVNWKEYLASEAVKVKGDHIAVVVAQGSIGDGRAPAGKIGGVSTAEMIRKATDDKDVKAIVLRVNSPGGSVLGSELIREQLQIARDKGKPVVVSMGDVAASGGYWISMAADAVIADPATITGSIGVFAMLPTAEGLMNKIGVNTGGYKTTWLAGSYDPRKALDPRVQQLVQTSIDHVYADFIGKVSKVRGMPMDKTDQLAQGRIWTGAQAVENRLVDRMGSFEDAVNEARKQVAKLNASAENAKKELPVRYAGPKKSPIEKLLQKLVGQVSGLLEDEGQVLALAQKYAFQDQNAALLSVFGKDLVWLQDVMGNPHSMGVAAHCLCDASP